MHLARRRVAAAIAYDFGLRSNPARPATAATIPPSSSQIVLSVGDPRNSREKLEPTESDALAPQMIRTIPTARSASEMGLFMINVFAD